MDSPLHVGMAVLDISKTQMYDLNYNKIIGFYWWDRIGISYLDTDVFIYWIKKMDMYEYLWTIPYSNDFDCTDYPVSHPTYKGGKNKKVLGKFKGESNGVLIEEIVALMVKRNAIKKYKTNELYQAYLI